MTLPTRWQLALARDRAWMNATLYGRSVKAAIQGKAPTLLHEVEVIAEDRHGNILFAETGLNTTTQAWERRILDMVYRDATEPVEYEIGLTDATLDATSTESDAAGGEPTGTGYSRVTLGRNNTDFPTLELHNSHYRVVSRQVTFENTEPEGGSFWSAVDIVFMVAVDGDGGRTLAFFRDMVNGSTQLGPGSRILPTVRPRLAAPA